MKKIALSRRLISLMIVSIIIISGLIFGLIHISGDVTINNFLMSIPYMIMGWTFGYIYYESDNIFTTMTLHFVHNTILFILQIIGG